LVVRSSTPHILTHHVAAILNERVGLHTRRGEIDLIAFDGDTLVFVQVKTHQMGTTQTRMRDSPLRWLSARQMARYRWVAEAWLADERYTCPSAQSMRFDAIGVIVDGKGAVVELRHVEG